MPHDARKLLHDIVTAVDAANGFLRNTTRRDYMASALLRSACERQLEIIGEALVRLRDHFPEEFGSIRDAHRVIGFRNRLIHGYDAVDDEIVWTALTTSLPQLDGEARRQLNALN